MAKEASTFAVLLEAFGLTTEEASRRISQAMVTAAGAGELDAQSLLLLQEFRKTQKEPDRLTFQKLAQEGKVDEIELRTRSEIEKKVASGEIRAAEQRLASQLQVERAGQIPEVKALGAARGEIGAATIQRQAQEALVAPQAARLRAELASVNIQIDKKGQPIPVKDLERRLKQIETAAAADPGLGTVVQEIKVSQGLLTNRKTEAREITRQKLINARVLLPEAQESALLAAEQRGLELRPQRTQPSGRIVGRSGDAEIFDQAVNAQRVQEGALVRIREATKQSGFRIRGGEIPSEGKFLTRQQPSFFGGRSIAPAEAGVQEALAAVRKGAPEAGGLLASAESGLQRAGRAPGKGKALAAGGLGLLALLSVLKGGGQQQQNPLIQAQLLQQFAAAQAKNQLSESRSVNQQAQAQQALARAMLLRTQALQNAGGPVAGVF